MSTASPQTRLEKFYTRREPFVVDDDGATTWESIGILFLALVLSSESLVDTLQEMTNFPADFVLAVLSVMEEGGWWFSLDFAHFVIAVRNQDETEINLSLDHLMVEFYENTDSETLHVLGELRDGYVFGGLRSVLIN